MIPSKTTIKHEKCPSCNNSILDDFFTVKNAPSQSIITVKSYDEAMAIPTRDITLSFCNSCGLIFNSSFDTTIDYFTQGYEDQQGFSPTFNQFIREITSRFINKHNVRGKDIVEIGCGKGDFLYLICELGNNRGTGIDPAFIPERSKLNPNVSFIKEFYSEKHNDLPKDAIVCRHTLEHIYDTNKFINTIRQSINVGQNTILFFEVPSIVRILEVRAFWDIFNEHCVYFSPGSLARLFRMNGFEVLDLYTEYQNQYLFLEAKPTGNNSQYVHPEEETVEMLKKIVEKFVININKQLTEWDQWLAKLKKQNKKVVVWGGGSKSVGFLTHFNYLKVINHVVDINPHMQGNFIPGIGIQYVNPEFLMKFRPDIVIVMNEVYKKEIEKGLSEMDLFPELVCL